MRRRALTVGTAAARRALFAVLAAALLAVSIAPVHAQSGDRVGMSLKAAEGEFTVGDIVPLTLEATYPSGYQVILPRLPVSWGPFEVRSQSPAVVVERDDGSSSIRQTIEVVLFAPGEHSTPELLVTVREPSGGITDIAAPMATVTVASVLGDDDLELRDIRPQAALPVPPLWPWFAAAFSLIVTVGAAVYYILSRRKPAAEETVPFVDPRSSYERALDELNEIEGMGLPSEGRLMEHYIRVSDCIREYVEGAFGLPAIDLTTDEVRKGLRGTAMQPEPSRWTVGLLEDCDLVKFAKYAPGASEPDVLIDRARRILEATRPEPEPADEGNTDGGGRAALVDAS